MPKPSHDILQNDALTHAARLDSRAPCIPQALAPQGTLQWSWTVRFVDSDADGRAELLMIQAEHSAAPHAGEPSPSVDQPLQLEGQGRDAQAQRPLPAKALQWFLDGSPVGTGRLSVIDRVVTGSHSLILCGTDGEARRSEVLLRFTSMLPAERKR